MSAAGQDLSVLELLVGSGALAVALAAWFVAWRVRRLTLRAGESGIEYFPPRPDPVQGGD